MSAAKPGPPPHLDEHHGLRPRAEFSGVPRPAREEIAALHHQAHEECYIANSVTAQVRCEPVHAQP